MSSSEYALLACMVWFFGGWTLQLYILRYWKRTDHTQYQWPWAIITSHGFQSVWFWSFGLVVLSDWRQVYPDNNASVQIFVFLLWLSALVDLLGSASAYWDVYKEYQRWHNWTAQPAQPGDEEWTFFYFGMHRREQVDIMEYEPNRRFDVIKRVYEDYKRTGIVKVPEHVHEPAAVVKSIDTAMAV